MFMSGREPNESPEERFLRLQSIKNIKKGINKKGGTGYLMSKSKKIKNKKKRK